ncbi:MAG: iron-sulfur cluster assembly scaffold protein [Nanoarchaeota archaeon]|nr:iron-sulfur cluster assembly scaffold protein [Nanoarchaeota archaeon]
MDEYTKKIVSYLKNPKYKGKLDKYDFKFSMKSKVCGDWNDIYFKLDSKIHLIEAISYENSGCSLNLVSLEIFCDYLIGKKIEEISNLNITMIREKLDFPMEKSHCIDLVLDCLKQHFNN